MADAQNETVDDMSEPLLIGVGPSSKSIQEQPADEPGDSYNMKIESSGKAEANTSIVPNTHFYSDCCGLRSPDKSIRRKAMIRCGACCFCSLAIILPVIFLVIIPAIIRGIVDGSGVDIQSAYIINPTDTSFKSSVTMSFTNVGSIPATLQMNDITISWDGDGGGNLATLSGSNAVSVSTSPVTVNSVATVVNAEALANFNKVAVLYHVCIGIWEVVLNIGFSRLL